MSIKIFLDQGHNPVNPNAGAEGNGLREQDLVYTIGQDLAMLLEADPVFEVRLSRPTPTTQLGTTNATSLEARVREANRWEADYFISLHTNAATSPLASGVEAYAFSRDTPAFTLGEVILRELSQGTGLHDRGMKARPGLYVLKKTRMPAVLVELGFITNPTDALLLRDEPGLFAAGIYRGILNYTKG